MRRLREPYLAFWGDDIQFETVLTSMGTQVRAVQASQYRTLQLATVALVRRVEPLSWAVLGRNLIDTYRWVDQQPSVVRSRFPSPSSFHDSVW